MSRESFDGILHQDRTSIRSLTHLPEKKRKKISLLDRGSTRNRLKRNFAVEGENKLRFSGRFLRFLQSSRITAFAKTISESLSLFCNSSRSLQCRLATKMLFININYGLVSSFVNTFCRSSGTHNVRVPANGCCQRRMCQPDVTPSTVPIFQ